MPEFCMESDLLFVFVEEFNGKILNPDLQESNFLDLHLELKNLFIMYIDSKAVDKIQFEKEIVENIRQSKYKFVIS